MVVTLHRIKELEAKLSAPVLGSISKAVKTASDLVGKATSRVKQAGIIGLKIASDLVERAGEVIKKTISGKVKETTKPIEEISKKIIKETAKPVEIVSKELKTTGEKVVSFVETAKEGVAKSVREVREEIIEPTREAVREVGERIREVVLDWKEVLIKAGLVIVDLPVLLEKFEERLEKRIRKILEITPDVFVKALIEFFDWQDKLTKELEKRIKEIKR